LEEEINLRDLIEVLIKGKWIIIGLTVISILAAGLISFNLPPTYEAKAVLLVKGVQQAIPKEGSDLDALLSMISQYPSMSMETYANQVSNPVILDRVIEKLGLDREKYNPFSLQKALQVESVKGTNLINIKLQGEDKKLITEVVNAVAEEFVAFISETSRESLGQSTAFLVERMKEEEGKIEGAVSEYKKFLEQPRGVNELRQEVQTKLEVINEFNKQLVRNKVEINSIKVSLEQVEKDLAETPEVLTTKKALSDDMYFYDATKKVDGELPGDLSQLQITNEEINPVYINLKQTKVNLKRRLADLEATQRELQEEIKKAQDDLKVLQAELAEKEMIDLRLTEKIKVLRDNYAMLSRKYEETRLAESAQFGESSIMLLTPALEPVEPVGPRKMLNMAIAGVLGVMVSVFLVFFIEFWRKSEPSAAAAGGKDSPVCKRAAGEMPAEAVSQVAGVGKRRGFD